ncbi:MAG: BPL-N domain-containing protein [Armatimonadota bacterium]
MWALHESTEGPQGRVVAIREMVARDDAVRSERMRILREQRRVAMVVGRTVSGWPDRLFADLGMDAPPRIEETEIENTDLSAYDLLIFPGGGNFALTDAGAEALRQFVRAGGGFVGVCAGAYAAKSYGLIENAYFPFRERGRCEISLRPHPITEGFHPRRLLDVRHANGPFIEVGEPSQAPVLYKAGPPYACVIAREFGAGRVVVFSAHPESDAESRPLTRNAILWAAKITGVDGGPEP